MLPKYFIKLFLYILSLIFFTEGSLASTHFQANRQKSIISQAQEETRLQNLRQSDSYIRIFSICSTAYDLNKLMYTTAAAKNLIDVLSFDRDEILKMTRHQSGLSPLLTNDLSSEGFFQATLDCQMTSEQRSSLIAQLIVLDLSGKILGGVSVFFLIKSVGSLMNQIRARSEWAFWGINTSGMMLALYQLIQKLKTPQETPSNSVSSDSSTEILEKNYDLSVVNQRTSDFKNLILSSLKKELAEIEIYIANGNENQKHVALDKKTELIQKINLLESMN